MTEPRFDEVQCLNPLGLHRMRWVEWGDVNNPRVLLCAHGLTRTGRDFDTLARVMSDVYRVVCPDVVGRGRSDWLTEPSHYAVPQYLADMVTLVAYLKPARLDWLGTSMGGLIGMAYAALPNNPINKLILNDVGPLLSGAALKRIGDYLGKPLSFASFDEGLAAVRLISASFGRFTEAEWRELAGHVLVQEPSSGRWKFHYDPAISQAFQLSTAQGDISLWPVYDAIKRTTLAIRGADSDLLSPETHAEMARRGPRAVLAELSECGHAPMFMHDNQIRVVRDFLVSD